MIIKEVQELAVIWHNTIIEKGYQSVTIEITCDPMNDKLRIKMDFYNSDWSYYSVPHDLRIMTMTSPRHTMRRVTSWVNALMNEEDAREEKLIEDYAKIKERIAQSRLSDIIKAEAEALMKRMTHNIIEHKPITPEPDTDVPF